MRKHKKELTTNTQKLDIAFFREQGAKGGKIGGPARARKLTPEQRTAIAKKAGATSAAKKKAAARQGSKENVA